METHQPIIIIGAPRSGTNMLRDILVELNDVGTWPCDEINYIWRHGNIHEKSDEFEANLARPKVRKYITNCFSRLSERQKLKWVVEKTCANSLRVPYVDRIFPDARYIFIYRNGYDTVASAKLRWKAKLNIPYILRKCRYVPIPDFPYYASRYFANRLYRLFSGRKRLSFWGPQLRDMPSLLNNHTLDEICALQWKECVEKADQSLKEMVPERVVRVKYEEFVNNPSNELIKICNHLNIPINTKIALDATKNVTPSSVGKGKQNLEEETISKIRPIIHDTLEKYGYSE